VRTLKRTDVGEELREVALFSEASRSELAQIRGLLMQMPIAAGTVLMHEGAVGSEFMILADGTAESARVDCCSPPSAPATSWGDGPAAERRTGLSECHGDCCHAVDGVRGTPREFRQILAVAPRWPKRSGAPATTRGLQAA